MSFKEFEDLNLTKAEMEDIIEEVEKEILAAEDRRKAAIVKSDVVAVIREDQMLDVFKSRLAEMRVELDADAETVAGWLKK